ncbi:DUF2282 domain-containing protein [Veronia pacifica]|uniref:DUF2282 domain-containing protein n=1 Tax=Veronia pacifica TaxID=1080227 RepID=A0A1C3EJM5_9GAMM|nr:DUF2282 domain-containing protein [Veronia pacifica]ODA33430.1 hypothetical protein A8L45_10290 [Veronia pacifica]
MKKSNIAAAAAVTSLLAMGATALTSAPAMAKEAKVKCYGVAQAGKNDCATSNSSCAGTSTVDGQKDAFILMPEKLCDRLAGSSLTAK